MSNWTHVAATFRVDSFRLEKINPEEEKSRWDEIFGKECLWDDPLEVWDDQYKNPQDYLPMGSEGTLHKSVWINPDLHHMAAYTISIFGDLRDHDSPDEIIEWFRDKCSRLYIRQAVITVDNELYGNRTECIS